MVQVYKVKMENMEVRKVEKEDLNINGKIYPILNVSFDDENVDRVILIDNDLERFNSYKKGQVGTLILKITNELFMQDLLNGSQSLEDTTTIEIEDFILND